MADGGNSQALKIFGGEVAQVFSNHLVLAEGCLVAFQTQVSQPTCDIHCRFSGSVTLDAKYGPIGPTVSRNGRFGFARKARPQAAVSACCRHTEAISLRVTILHMTFPALQDSHRPSRTSPAVGWRSGPTAPLRLSQSRDRPLAVASGRERQG